MNKSLLNEKKKSARLFFKKKRDALLQPYREEASRNICAHGLKWVTSVLAGRESVSTVCAYLQTGSEVDLMQLVKNLDCQVAIGMPRVVDKVTLEFRMWRAGDSLVMNRFGIPEPSDAAPLASVNSSTIFFVPALAVDQSGVRLGYGGGYYDRFLSKVPGGCIKVAVTFNAMICERLPVDSHDIPMDYILTELGVQKL